MTLEEFEKLIDHFKCIEEYIDRVSDVGISLIETDLYDNMWHVFNDFILEKEFNDEQNAIISDWMYEHEFGKEPIRVKVDGKEDTISTAKDLYKFIDLIK